MKGLILAGGKGTRLRPLTFTRAKPLIPIANKPNLFYAVEDLVAAKIHEIGIVIGPETGEEVKEAMGDGSRWGVRFTYILQECPKGIAHAVSIAQKFLGDDPFMMYLGDNLLSGGVTHLVDTYESTKCDGVVLVTPVENPSQFGVAILDENGRAVQLVEKPKDPPSNLALVGVYLLTPEIHKIIADLKPSKRGEYEITDAIHGLIEQGKNVIAHRVRGWWKDTGKPEDLLDANRLVLSSFNRLIQGEVVESQITGEVVIGEGASVIHSSIRGPVYIAAGTEIRDSYIGPYTSIGAKSKVINSEVEYSILLDKTEIRNLPNRLDASIIGLGSEVCGEPNGSRRHTVQLVLGDQSQVRL